MKKLLSIFTLFFLLLNSDTRLFSQIRERPKIKNFGVSLNRPPEENLAPKRIPKKENVSDDVIKIDTNLVILNCLVLDKKGNAIYGLKKEDFIITENEEPQNIQIFTLGDDANIPRSIVLIIDYSSSQLPFIETSVEAAKQLVDKLRPMDLMSLVTDDVELISEFTSDKEKLKKKLNGLKKSALGFKFGKSLQYSAIYAVLNELFDEEDVRPIILFQTDGDQLFNLKNGLEDIVNQRMFANRVTNIRSKQISFTFEDLRKKVENSRTTIYSIVPGFNRLGLSEKEKLEKFKIENEIRRKLFEKKYGKPSGNPLTSYYLEQRQKIRDELAKKYYPGGLPDIQEGLWNLSKTSGGWIDFLEKPEDAGGVYSRILSEINTRYIIGFMPTNETKDGTRRTVKIEVKNHPEYIVWGRKTYVAPLPD